MLKDASSPKINFSTEKTNKTFTSGSDWCTLQVKYKVWM